MNLKIIIFPLLIFVIIVFSIWFIYPSYLSLVDVQGKLAEANKKLENIEQKRQTAERLHEEVTSSQGYQQILTSLLPAEKSEEQIVNELNDIIFTQGMTVYGISFESGGAIQEIAPAPALDEFGNPLIDPNTGLIIYSETIPKIKNVQAKVGAVGDYDKIKGFLRKMISLKRTNKIASIKISREQASPSSEGQAAAGNGALRMDVAVDFTYLEKVRNAIDVNDGIFTAGQFNFSILDEIWKTKNTVVPELKADFQGGANPFVL